MKKKGIFICIEGLDGAGKTTQTKLLIQQLKKSYDVLYTSEPSKGLIGSFIREKYLYGENRLSPFVEALLFAADRIQHVQTEILPALKQGKIVVCDRYIYSSLAYQGASEVDLQWIKNINKSIIYPDLAIYLDIDPVKVLQRLNSKRSIMENLETQKKVRNLYLRFVRTEKLTLVNADKSKNKVAKDLFIVVQKFLKGF